MNIQHLYYFKALAERRNYQDASKSCHISQPALSMAIKSLESELGHPLVNRNSKPISLTSTGESFFTHTKKILFEYETMLNELQFLDEDDQHLRIGVIPTLAPYLVPRFIGPFMKAHPELKLELEETKTEILLEKLKRDELDAAILVTPIQVKSIDFKVMFYEEFLVYSDQVMDKQYILPEEIDPSGLWLLEEGHCMRDQIINFCELKKNTNSKLNYHAGSIETLINLVDQYQGVTIIPELASFQLNKSRKKRLIPFCSPSPVREVSMAIHRFSVRLKIVIDLIEHIKQGVPKYMKHKSDSITVPIEMVDI